VGWDISLKEIFPRLCSISSCKDKVASDLGVWTKIGNTKTHTWNLVWRRELFVREKEQLQ